MLLANESHSLSVLVKEPWVAFSEKDDVLQLYISVSKEGPLLSLKDPPGHFSCMFWGSKHSTPSISCFFSYPVESSCLLASFLWALWGLYCHYIKILSLERTERRKKSYVEALATKIILNLSDPSSSTHLLGRLFPMTLEMLYFLTVVPYQFNFFLNRHLKSHICSTLSRILWKSKHHLPAKSPPCCPTG